MTYIQLYRDSVLETIRANKAREAETHRSNVEQEKIGRANVALGYANVGLGYANLSESSRHNLAYEMETNRHNAAVERETARKNNLDYNTKMYDISQQNARADASLAETLRHNQATEKLNLIQTGANFVSSLYGSWASKRSREKAAEINANANKKGK